MSPPQLGASPIASDGTPMFAWLPRLSLLLLCCLAALSAADPDAWKKDLGPTGDGWKKTPQDLIFNNAAEPRYLDQHLMTGVLEGRVAMALFEGLTSLDPRTLEPRAGVASSWESSADGLDWTFHLRAGERWSDGTPITSETFRASWLRLLDPTTGAAYAELLDMVAGAEARRTNKGPADAVGISAPDPLTFKVRLARPCPWLLSVCAFQCLYPVPMHVIAKHGDRWTLAANMVSNGPFIMKEWLPRERIVLVPNPNWRGRNQVRLNSITMLPYDDTDAAYRLFRQGGLHWMPSIPLPKLDEVRLLPEYYVSPYLGSSFYRFNCSKPPFNDKRVRKAFSLAIDRTVITGQVLKAGQKPATWFTPAVAGYQPPPGLSTDREAARKLLVEAGYGPGGKTLPRIELFFNSDESNKKVAEAIAAQWEAALGVKVELVNKEWKAYLADMDALGVAEGYRHLTHLLAYALDLYLDADPERPVFTPLAAPTQKILGDNVDSRYHF
ncbi:MAG: peptide ABC transporter substrate-binding protein, partial [Planctomycetota bacterium]